MELIAATTTATGLRVEADLDAGYYPTGVKVTDAELAAVPLLSTPPPLRHHEFHPD